MTPSSSNSQTTALPDHTMLGAVYKICLICLVETLKLIGETLQQVIKDPRESNTRPSCQSRLEAAVKLGKVGGQPPPPPVPSRTRSKVMSIRTLTVNKNWLRQSKKAAIKNCQRSRSVTVPGCRRTSSWSSFGRSLNLSRQCLSRRHSYPPFRSSNLEMVAEEDEQ
jgi:hypothetical protein